MIISQGLTLRELLGTQNCVRPYSSEGQRLEGRKGNALLTAVKGALLLGCWAGCLPPSGVSRRGTAEVRKSLQCSARVPPLPPPRCAPPLLKRPGLVSPALCFMQPPLAGRWVTWSSEHVSPLSYWSLGIPCPLSVRRFESQRDKGRESTLCQFV